MTETFPLFFFANCYIRSKVGFALKLLIEIVKEESKQSFESFFYSVEVFFFFHLFFVVVFQNVFNRAILIVKYYPEFSNMCPYASLWETRKRVRRKSGHSEQEFVASFINTNFTLTSTFWADDDFSWTINFI